VPRSILAFAATVLDQSSKLGAGQSVGTVAEYDKLKIAHFEGNDLVVHLVGAKTASTGAFSSSPWRCSLLHIRARIFEHPIHFPCPDFSFHNTMPAPATRSDHRQRIKPCAHNPSVCLRILSLLTFNGAMRIICCAGLMIEMRLEVLQRLRPLLSSIPQM
jgi:hypothetical protein